MEVAEKLDFVDEAYRVIEEHNYLSYDEKTKVIWVSDIDISNEVVNTIMALVESLRYVDADEKFTVSTPIHGLSLHYYDQCLSRYCSQMLDEGRKHSETCWVKSAEKNVSLGISKNEVEDVLEYLHENRKYYPEAYEFLKINEKYTSQVSQDDEGWVFLKYLLPFEQGNRDKVKSIIKQVFPKNSFQRKDRVLDVVASIRRSGWDEKMAWSPQGSVLGYSRSSCKYSSLTGRHRVAAASYLYQRKELPEDFKFNFPVISFPWHSIRTSRPCPGDKLCDNCLQ